MTTNQAIQELLDALLPTIPKEVKVAFLKEQEFNFYLAFKYSGRPLKSNRGIRAFATFEEADDYRHMLTFEDELIVRKCEDLL